MRGRKPILDPILVAAKLTELNGNLAAVARFFGVSRTAVFKLVERKKSLQEVVLDARQSMIDYTESALYKAALDGQGWAVCFFLKTQAKDRGYIEKSGTDSLVPPQTVVVIEREGNVAAPTAAETEASRKEIE